MDETGEGRVWMSINRHWSSNIRLWIFPKLIISLDLSPIIVDETRESGVWVSIHWHWSSDVWSGILTLFKLRISPIIMNEAGEV